MAGYFFDTSALVKRYRIEPGTDTIDALFARADSIFIISRLAIIETTSAFALKVRAGELQDSDYEVTRKKFLGDVSDGTVKVVRLASAHYRAAERLINSYALGHRLRTLDALQLSVALDLHLRGRIETFVCADEVLCEISAFENLATLNPTVSK